MACDVERFKRFFHMMLDEGVYLAPSAFEAGLMSVAHTGRYHITPSMLHVGVCEVAIEHRSCRMRRERLIRPTHSGPL